MNWQSSHPVSQHSHNKPFLDQIWYLVTMIQSVTGLRCCKAFLSRPAAKPSDVYWLCSAADPVHHDFLNLRSQLSKAIGPTKKNPQLWLALVNRKGLILFSIAPDYTLQINTSEFEWIRPQSFVLFTMSTTHCQATTSSSILTTFLGEDTSASIRKQKVLSEHISRPEAWSFKQ